MATNLGSLGVIIGLPIDIIGDAFHSRRRRFLGKLGRSGRFLFRCFANLSRLLCGEETFRDQALLPKVNGIVVPLTFGSNA